jgi:hypothetical protein
VFDEEGPTGRDGGTGPAPPLPIRAAKGRVRKSTGQSATKRRRRSQTGRRQAPQTTPAVVRRFGQESTDAVVRWGQNSSRAAGRLVRDSKKASYRFVRDSGRETVKLWQRSSRAAGRLSRDSGLALSVDSQASIRRVTVRAQNTVATGAQVSRLAQAQIQRQWQQGLASARRGVQARPTLAQTLGCCHRLLQAAMRDWGTALSLLSGIFFAAYLLWHVFDWGRADQKILIGDFAFVPINFAVVLLAARVARHSRLDAQTRRAWTIIAAAYLSYAVGNALWFYYEALLQEAPSPSLADIGYILFYPLLLWVCSIFWSGPLRCSGMAHL